MSSNDEKKDDRPVNSIRENGLFGIKGIVKQNRQKRKDSKILIYPNQRDKKRIKETKFDGSNNICTSCFVCIINIIHIPFKNTLHLNYDD